MLSVKAVTSCRIQLYKWFDLVNRGGLFPLNDNSFSLFVAIEKVVKTVLESHMLSRTANKESFKQNVHDVIAANENVQFFGCILSQDIDDPEQSEELEIIKLWVTVRGFSMVASWVEAYKHRQKKTVQKSTSLRKSINGTFMFVYVLVVSAIYFHIFT